MKAVILAGGRGSRLGALTDTLPKPLIPVADKAVIVYQLELLQRHGIREVILLCGYLGDTLEKALGDGSTWNLRLEYVHEAEPLGTAGALTALSGKLDEDFVLFSGDILLNFDLERLMNWHTSRPEAALTVVVHPNDHPLDSDLVEVDADQRVVKILTRPHPEGLRFRNLSIASVYVVSPRVLDWIDRTQKTDLEKHLFPVLLNQGLALYAYNTPEYLKDTGTPRRLAHVSADVASGRFERAHRRFPSRAVLLDRDGVINQEGPPVLVPDDLRLYPGAAEAIGQLNRAGWRVLVVTNQAAVAKGWLSLEALGQVHQQLETELGKVGAWIDGIYVCPHHPESGFPGEISALKKVCPCRKPAAGLLEQAIEDFNLDRSQSLMIGDASSDAAAAQAAGLRFMGVETGHGLQDGRSVLELPPRCVRDLPAAVDLILEEHP
ncbi:MAG: HAD-IIIA family hydrolase [Candidatus Sericytochromatia bacterium]